jgi:transcriptional regulator with XRE-family HTH domain
VIDQKPVFDFDAFYRALSATREARRVTWKQVSAEAAVHQSTLARMAQSRRPDADGLAALSAWAGLNPGDFMRGFAADRSTEPLAAISRTIQQDPNLSPESAAALDDIVRTAYRGLVERDAARSGAASFDDSGHR